MPQTSSVSNPIRGSDQDRLFRSLGVSAVAACIAEATTLPLDTVKVRLQLQKKQGFPGAQGPLYRTPLQTLGLITKLEGPAALFKGLEAGLHRQFLFTGLRIGLYGPIQEAIAGPGVPTESMPTQLKVLSALITSSIGITLANPADVVKVRTQAAAGASAPRVEPSASSHSHASSPGISRGNGSTPSHTAQPLVCKNSSTQGGARQSTRMMSGMATARGPANAILQQSAVKTYFDIIKRDGFVGGLYAGYVPNLLRNTIISASELVAYDLSKQKFKQAGLQEGPCLHIASGLTAGFVATVFGSPMDVVSTRIMVNRGRPGQASGMLQSCLDMYRLEGLRSFYQGFLPNFLRIGSFNVVLWMSYEQLKLHFGPA